MNGVVRQRPQAKLGGDEQEHEWMCQRLLERIERQDIEGDTSYAK
jgi:hypothetical protein